MSVAALRMNRLTLRYADANAEQAFALEQGQKSLRPVRVMIITMVVLTVTSVLLGILAFRGTFSPDQRPWMLGVTGLVANAIGYAVTRSRVFLHRNQWILFVFTSLGSAATNRFA